MACVAHQALIPRDWNDEAMAAMLPSLAASPWGPLSSPRDAFGNAHLYEFTHGRSHALMAVRPVDLARGRRLDVVGLVSDGDRLPAAVLDFELVRLARGYQACLLAQTTQRPHLVKQCLRTGWLTTGAVMLKVVP
ncbi:MAG: hypothetical protein V4609_13310 [Pseudomonadota bacterium]